MGGQKSEPTQPTGRQANQPRQTGIGMYCFSSHLYLPIFVPPYLYAYLRAYLCRLFACLCGRIST